MSAVYFILMLGGLIFFHELGHYLVARASGVHVETFSIGFGPPLLRWTGKSPPGCPPTEYVLAALPLGGYVKMLGADPGEEENPELAPHSFATKPLWKRFSIVSAGPAFNLILPYFIFFGVGLATPTQTPSAVGMVDASGVAAEAGIQPGDRILSVDGEEVHYWWELQRSISARPGLPTDLVIDRAGQPSPVSLTLTPRTTRTELLPGLDLVDEVGRIGIIPAYLEPYVAVPAGLPAHQAGLRTGDKVTALNGSAVHSLTDLLDRLGSTADQAVTLSVVRNKANAAGWPQELLAPESHTFEVPAAALGDRGIASAGCVAREVIKGSRASEIGLRAGDIIWSLDGRMCRHWGFLEATLGATAESSHTLSWFRGEASHTVERTGWVSLVTDKVGRGDMKIRTFGLATHPPISRALDAVPNEHRFSYAVIDAVTRTHEVIRMNVAAITGLFSGKVPLTELSGPIGIAQMAARTTERGWGYFFSLMVWLSVSLGLLNLLPIPILDGGHILFLALEGIKRRPVSLRTRQIATYVGLAFIMMLFILAFKNDLERPW